jgi:hypothetical protein
LASKVWASDHATVLVAVAVAIGRDSNECGDGCAFGMPNCVFGKQSDRKPVASRNLATCGYCALQPKSLLQQESGAKLVRAQLGDPKKLISTPV